MASQLGDSVDGLSVGIANQSGFAQAPRLVCRKKFQDAPGPLEPAWPADFESHGLLTLERIYRQQETPMCPLLVQSNLLEAKVTLYAIF
jgi:hypothetical protein